MMGLLRLGGGALALSLIIGELWRSWGAGRHWLYVFDDIWMGLLLLSGAIVFSRDTVRRRALFAAGWGAASGMLYSSFVSKLVAPASSNPGNWSIEILTFLVGAAFFLALAGMILILIYPGPARK